MCSGRVDLSFVLRAFSKGMDGVFIGGCHLNECNYVTDGNYHALSMVLLCRRLMEHMGLFPERLRLEWVSSGEGIRFAEIMNDFAGALKELGPLGAGEGIDPSALKLKLEAATRLVPYIRLVEREKLRVPVKSSEAYHRFYDSDDVRRLFDAIIGDKLALGQISLLLEEEPHSTREISEILGMPPSDVSRHLNSSSRQGLVRYDMGRKCYVLA
jgi:F420-non-reducing hydrogenase iron-sulfur subunit